jgi:predicted ester cyclase
MEDLLTGGDRFASRTRVTGTHTGDLMGMPATGKRISVEAVDIGSTANGQAQERWGGLSRALLDLGYPRTGPRQTYSTPIIR